MVIKAKQRSKTIQMGLDNFSTGEGPRTYKRGGKRDPNKSSGSTTSYENSAYQGCIHVPRGMNTPDLAKKLRLEVHQVERLIDVNGDALFISTTGDRMATSLEAMVKTDKLNLQHIEQLDDLDELVKYIIDNADMCEEIKITEPEQEPESKVQKASNDEDQSGLGAFMS